MSATIKVAILGFGLSGAKFHAPLISALDGFELSYIYVTKPSAETARYPQAKVITELSEILADQTVSLVIVALPNEQHYSVTKACLLADKNVVVEKPFVNNLAEGEELIALAREKKLLLSVYHNRRWDNGYLTLQKILPTLGKISLYEAYFDRFRPQVNNTRWREQPQVGSGILFDLGSHLLDQALNLFGTPLAINAELLQQRQAAQVTDYFELRLSYPQLRVVLGSSSLIAAPRPILAAYGDCGSYVKHGLDPQETMLRSGILPMTPNYGLDDNHGELCLAESDGLVCQAYPSVAGRYQDYYLDIQRALHSGSIPAVDAADALNVIKLIHAAELSAAEQRTVYL